MLTRIHVAAALALSLLCMPSWAQLEPNSEPDSLGPLGGSAISLAADPSDPDALLLIQYIEGLFRSADGGETRTPYG
ncbi:MAG: hypothetical protein DRQ55_20465, partial [Planctomycetota bacterium]